MKKLSNTMKKVWVIPVAAALITGSGLTMNYLLSSSTFAAGMDNQVIQLQTAGPQPKQTLDQRTVSKPGYTLIDQSKTYTKDKILKKLQLKEASLPQAQLEKKVKEMQSTFVPGDKDLSAGQAAACGADVLIKAFGAHLDGYTARAAFLKGNLPGSDTWTIWFDPASQAEGLKEIPLKSYMVLLNSVNGTVINASSSDDLSQLKKADLNDADWKEKAEKTVTALLPKNVSVISSKVVASDGLKIGVPVLCELSDGTAYEVGMAENKEVVNLYYFQNGYEGSLDKTINEQKHGIKLP